LQLWRHWLDQHGWRVAVRGTVAPQPAPGPGAGQPRWAQAPVERYASANQVTPNTCNAPCAGVTMRVRNSSLDFSPVLCRRTRGGERGGGTTLIALLFVIRGLHVHCGGWQGMGRTPAGVGAQHFASKPHPMLVSAHVCCLLPPVRWAVGQAKLGQEGHCTMGR
jgi:hypothetical protein